MNLIQIKKSLRKKIFPSDEIITLLKKHNFKSCLDVGSGTGFFLETLYEKEIIKTGVGIEVDEKYFRKINKDLEIFSKEDLDKTNKTFDLIVFNDVLHHIDQKKPFIDDYVKLLSKDGYLFIKDMNPKNPFCKYFNRLHDLIFAQEIIKEITQNELVNHLNTFTLSDEGTKRIFLYDHYYLLLKRISNR